MASDQSRAVLDLLTSEDERAHNIECLQKNTVGCVGKTNISQMSEINGGIKNKTNCGSAANMKNLKPIKTH